MNFVKQVEEHLRDISSSSAPTAKSKRSSSSMTLPGLKESSERAILTLRTLQTQYVSAVRRASAEGSPHPKTNLFKNQDILRPFLLAANFPQVSYKTLDQAFEGIRVLGEGDAINWKEDSKNIVRVLTIQCNECVYHLLDEHNNGSRIGGTLKDNAGAAVGMVSSIGSSILTGLGIGTIIGGSSTNQSSKERMKDNNDHDKVGNAQLNSTNKRINIAHTSVRTIKEDEGIAIRILQLINMIVDMNGKDLTKEILSQCISICLLFYFDHDHEERVHFGSNSIGASFSRRTSIDSTLGNLALSGSSAKKVSRAASATLRQIVSTVFDRVVINTDTLAQDDSAHILAKMIFSDLCDIMDCDDVKNLLKEAHDDPNEWISRKGAVGQALLSQHHSMLPPMKNISFDLIELIIDHQVRLSREDDEFETTGFCIVLKEKFCPVAIRILDAVSFEFLNTEKESVLQLPTLEYSLRMIHLMTKVIKFYGHFNWLRLESRDMLMAVGKIIKVATDSIRDSDEFEDGFIYEKQDDSLSSSKSEDSDERPSDLISMAGVVIEVLYMLIVDNFIELVPLFTFSDGEKNEILLSTLIGFTCDFAVVASSSKGTISKVIIASEKISSHNDDGIQTRKGGNFKVEKIHTDISKKVKDSEHVDCGEVVWLALQTILFTWKKISECNGKYTSLIDGCFASSLAVIQHFIRRCPASDKICKSSLTGYLFLTDCVIPTGQGSEFQRLVLFNSLCKLMFPPREDNDQKTLRKHNLYAIALLFEILNSHADNLGAEWNVIAETLAKLSSFPLSGTHQSQIISSNLSKIGSLHFSDTGLVEFMEVIFSSLLKTSPSLSNRREATGSLLVDEFCIASLQKLQRNGASIHSKSLRELPYELVLIIDSMLENFRRLHLFYETLARNLSSLVAMSPDNNVKVFCLDILSFLIASALSKVDEADETRINAKVNKVGILQPLCHCIYILDDAEEPSSHLTDAAELGLNYLKQIITDGYDLSSAWLDIISALSHVARSKNNHKEYTSCCILAFGCLKLVADDFQNASSGREDELIQTTRLSLLDCCSSFGFSSADVNISLTAIGMLWTIADQSSLSSSSSVDYVLDKLANLASDKRVEVRNCVVNTLFSCVVGLGQKFSSSQWKRVFRKAIFAILDQTVSNVEVHEAGAVHSEAVDKYKVSVHHSRDTISKQWMTTRVLALRGIERVLRQYFELLTIKSNQSDGPAEVNWLECSWDRILLECSNSISLLGGRDTLDLRLVGSDLLSLCCQVSSRRGFIAADARVGTNMEVVNGALRTVRPSEHSTRLNKSSSEEIILDPEIIRRRDRLFTKSFSHLISFGNILLNNKEAMRDDENGINLQFLGKFTNGLSDVYESCKDYELSPTEYESRNEDDFVNLLEILCDTSKGPPGSKFLNQAQKSCLNLLKAMIIRSSSKALEALAQLSKQAFCKVSDERDSDILGTEAGKILSDICSHEKIKVKISRRTNGLLVSIDLPNVEDHDEKSSTNTKENDDIMMSNVHDKQAKLQEENRQLNELNAELMKQFEKLRQDKERLEQQVAVLSEGSSYM